jgi:hypothetical protein
VTALVLLSTLLTHSRLKSARACKRQHKFKYLDGYRAVLDQAELAFGDLVHKGLEAWWLAVKAELPVDAWLDAALAALRVVKGVDAFDLARAEVMLLGYHERWAAEALLYEVLGVEESFDIALINPATGAPSTFWRLGGKLDVRVRRRSDGRRGFIEHKTSSEDVSLGSAYWKRLLLDMQVSIYFDGAAALFGEPADFCIYDVLGKPAQRPAKATPPEKREYTQEKSRACPLCKKKSSPPAPHHVDVDGVMVACADGRIVTDPGGRLYATMRADDETPEEYQERLCAAITAEPLRYFVRGEVQRLEAELEEARFDIWQEAAALRESIRAERYPRNPEACGRCAFFDVCTGMASLEDTSRFTRTDNVHPELAGVSHGEQGSKEESPTP